ncbi:MAG TPA: hypothetical protein VLD67_19230 [Vicinamibacterales bacterium]|nr:hypothetical protein [Vicinamibacterales bacterium]
MQEQDRLRSFLARVRRRWFAQVVLQTVGRAAACAAAAGLLALAAERLFRPEGPALVLLAAVAVLAALLAAALAAWRIERRPDDVHVARFVEERAGTIPDVAPFDDAVVSAVDGGGDAAPGGFRPLLVAAALRRLDEITPRLIVMRSSLRRSGAQAVAGSALLVATLVLARAPLTRAIETARLTMFPASIHLDVQPGDARIVAGRALEIRALVRAGDRILTRLTPSLTVEAGGAQRTVAMTLDGDSFAFPFESVDRTFTYRISAGAATSPDYTVTALFPPRVRQIDVRYEYPAFTGLRPRDEQDGGDIYGPAGTKVRVRVHTDKPIRSGEMSLGGAEARPLRSAGSRLLEADLVLTSDDSYRLSLTDADGLRSRGDIEYFIRVMDDRPPDVRILRPAGDQQITPLEEVVIEARADDDHGISAFELVYSVAGRQARVVPFVETSDAEVAKIGSHLLAAEGLDVQPGDLITYYARAVDVARGKRPTEARSDMYFLEVRPFHEEFVAAQSQAGGGMGGTQIDSLIAAQKEIISATWNIERRSAAGRSAEDIGAVAAAQAELKARVEQMLSRGGRGRSVFRMPQQVAPPRPGRAGSGSEGVRAAVDAMGHAVEQLRGERTKEALPHEMAALQGLLQAQAEIRRREVLQQAAAGAGGSGRQGEDLSALFDRELQRQQRTNYETRSQVEQRPDDVDRARAVDRIRDLARRQEDLARRQRELAAASLSDEERKRQLERLQREQTELREQVEETARRMEQQSGQQSGRDAKQGGQSGGSGDRRTNVEDGRAAAGLREASEQMRSAAGDLERNSPDAAAARGARAAEQLRGIEQQIRGSSPEALERAAGELRLEAQQITEEQRRIAAEAERLDRGTMEANADARRRLAGEKEQLADRVDAVHRGASELARQQRGDGPAGEASMRAAEAAREIERQQIGSRMRETAKQMREGRESGPAAEEQIARSLDRVVEHLGGAGPESRNLSTALDRTREIRERLDRLEREIRDEEARQNGPDARGGRQGRAGRPGSPAAGGGSSDALQKLRDEYARELRSARDTLERLERSAPRTGLGGSTPEREERSQAEQGHEASKQDFADWAALRKDVELALERQETAASTRQARNAEDRLSAGGSDRIPDAYRKLIARYYESLARVKK